MVQNCLGLPVACAISKSFMLNKSFTQVQSAHLSHLPSVSSVIVVSLQPPIHLIKIGGLTPISLNHLSSWFCGPPICVSNLSLVHLKCQCGGASMYLLAMDFPWNVPFSVRPEYVACFDRQWLWSIYFLAGCGDPTCWYTTIVRWVAVSTEAVTHVDAFKHTIKSIRLNKIRSDLWLTFRPMLKAALRCFIDNGNIKNELDHQNIENSASNWRGLSMKPHAGNNT